MPRQNSVNFTEIIKQVAEDSGIKQKVCKNVLKSFKVVVLTNISKGNRVEVRSFGTFYLRNRKSGTGRNMNDGGASSINYGPKKQLAFTASEKHKDM